MILLSLVGNFKRVGSVDGPQGHNIHTQLKVESDKHRIFIPLDYSFSLKSKNRLKIVHK
jgi:hypothetical protein